MSQQKLMKQKFNNEHGDILHKGAIEALLYSGYNLFTSLIEGFDNSRDKSATIIKLLISEKDNLLFWIDNGIGANKEGLKRLSTLHDIVAAHKTKQGLFNVGEKYMLAFLTKLFKDFKHLVSKDEKTIIEILQTTITIISENDDYNKVDDVPISSICIDFLTPLNGGIYKNDPRDANKFQKAILKMLLAYLDPTAKTGIVKCIPLDNEILEEIQNIKNTNNTISNSLLFKLGKRFNKDLTNGIKMSIEFVKEVEITVNSENNFCVQIVQNDDGKENYDILPYDSLHYDDIPEENKIEHIIDLYEKNDVQSSDDLPKVISMFKHNGALMRVVKNKEVKLVQESAKNLDLSKYTKKGSYSHRITYSDDWSLLDNTQLKAIFGHVEHSSEDRLLLNTVDYERNNRIIDLEQTKQIITGSEHIRVTTRHSRQLISFDADLDEYIGLLQKKTELNKSLIHSEIVNNKEWCEDNIYKRINAVKAPIKKAEKKARESQKKKEQEERYEKIRQETLAKHGLGSNKSKKKLKVEEDSDDDEESCSSSSENSSSDIAEQELENDDCESESESDSGSVLDSSETNQVAAAVPLETETQSENIGFTFSEQASEAGSGSDSESSHSSKIEAIITSSNRKATKAEYIGKKPVIDELKNWEQKADLHKELDEQLHTLFKVYGVLHEHSFEFIFNKLSIKDKIEIIIIQINKKYPYDTVERIDGGINFHRAYEQHIK
jgi:hypothetical protein